MARKRGKLKFGRGGEEEENTTTTTADQVNQGNRQLAEALIDLAVQESPRSQDYPEVTASTPFG